MTDETKKRMEQDVKDCARAREVALAKALIAAREHLKLEQSMIETYSDAKVLGARAAVTEIESLIKGA